MGVIVRRVLDRQDCESVVALTAAAFPEEVRGSGLTRHWTELELEDLVKQSWCWANIGAQGRAVFLDIEDPGSSANDPYQPVDLTFALDTSVIARWSRGRIIYIQGMSSHFSC